METAQSAPSVYKDPVFYTPAANGKRPEIIGFGKMVDGILRDDWSNRNLDDFRARADYAHAEIGEYEVVRELIEGFFKTSPQEITAEEWDYALNVLPPMDWTRSAGQSFKMSEMEYGRITAIFCTLGSRYFKFNDVCTLKHHEIVAKVTQYLETTQANHAEAAMQ